MNYLINHKQLTCINILIRTLQEAINRECFTETEIDNILKAIIINLNKNIYYIDEKTTTFNSFLF